MNTFRGDSAVTAQLSGISTGGVSEGGHLTGDQVKDSADTHSVVQESWSQLVGLMLSAPPVELARGLKLVPVDARELHLTAGGAA